MRTTKNGLRGLMLRGAALLILLFVAALPAQAQTYYVFMYNNNGTFNFLADVNDAYQPIDNVQNDFSYATCVWTRDNDGRFYNYCVAGSQNRWLQNYNNTLIKNASDNGNNLWTITGNAIYNNASTNRYIRWSGTAWQLSTTNSNRNIVYQITGPSVASITAPTITGTTVFDELRSYSYTGSNSSYTAPYYTMTGPSTYYVVDGGTPQTATTSFTTTTGITYSWTLENSASYDDGHVRISGNSVEYYNSYGTETTLTLRAVATHTASSTVSTATSQTLTFMPLIDPTSLTISSGNTMTVYVGSTGNITYSFLPDPCYNNVTFASDATSVATVNASGVVTGVSTGTATITVTAYKLDGTTNASLTKTVTVTVKNKVATPVITFTPDPSDNTQATAEITCATPGTTIYYTLNSGAETAYSSAFPVNEYDVVNAYAVKTSNPGSLWDDSDPATNTYVSCSTGAPTISYLQSGTTANVTITAETGATIYYTTDGSDPSTSNYTGTGTSPVTFNGVANGTTVKAVAKNGTCSQSAIVSMDMVLSGVSGGVVTLNDREDHSWSYYSDATLPAQLRSLNPADVKITYYGDGIMMTGSADYTASSTDYITSTHGDYKVGAKVNVGGENENTFVYYKTLERTDGSTSANPTGRCPYKPIPNPFQVRPRYKDRGTTDANDFTGWRGFQCWRLKSFTGGSVYSAASGGTALSTGAVINAETEIYFAPTAEYGMEVELEAVWAIAYVTKANGNGENAVGTNNVGYERNFCVPTTGAGYTLYTGTGKRITNANHIPVTISCYYPDGTAPDNTNNSISNTATSLTADTKFENISISMTSNTLTLANYDIIVGRGCGTSTINTLQAINGNVTDLDYTIRLESGTVNNFSFVRTSSCTVSGRYMVRGIMGSDYDRAKGDNDKLSISPNSTLFFSTSVTFSGASNKDQKTFDCVFKSGKYQSQQWNGTTQSGQQGYQHVAYLGQNSAGNTYAGVRYVTVEGGEFSGMCGGRGVGSESTTYMTPDVITFDLRIKGGTFHGAVYGGAADNPSIGSRRFIITGGEIQSWIAGGCNGTGSTSGTGATNGNSYIYVGGTTLVGGDNSMTINETNGGQVFGAGRGISGRASSVNHSHVAIADEAVVCNNNNTADIPVGGNVYGGSYNGTIANVSNVYILGGRVEGSAFGGSFGNGTAIPAANVTMTGGFVTDGVYGGSNSTGNVTEVTMHIDGGTVGTGDASDGVFGGGLGNTTRILGSVNLTVGANVGDEGVTVNGDVYGGSAQGKTNGNTSRTAGAVTNVTLNAGTINGSLYGGGLGNNTYAADVYGPVAVKVYGGTLNVTSTNGSGSVYGCNNINGAPQNSVTVDIYGTNPQPDEGFAIDNVYGGGNQAAYANANYPTVTVHNCNNSIGNVYGGGNAAAVTNTNVTIYGGNRIGAVYAGGNGTGVASTFQMVTGNAVAKIYGGTIDRVFAGNNSSGIVNGTKTVTIDASTDETVNPANGITCGNSPMKIGAVFQGGNQAAGTAGTVNIVCTGATTDEYIDTLFGGANNANIIPNTLSGTSNITLTIDRGYIRTGIFGGNNSGGSVTGDITVNVKKNSGGTCVFDYPTVFGGGYGAGTSTGGDITINVGEKTATNTAPTINATIAGGAVYGGSALGSVNASSSDNTLINIYNGTIAGNIYGGGLGEAGNATKGMVNGVVTINIGADDQTDGNCQSDLTACSIYGCNNTGGSPQRDVYVNIYRTGHTAKNLASYHEADATFAIDQVFGGGNQADYAPAGDNKTRVHVYTCANTIRRLFGGGNAAAALGLVTTLDGGRYEWVFGGGNGEAVAANVGAGGTNLTINAGRIAHLFGGSNERGTITGPMLVNVNYSNEGLTGCEEQIDEFFGGGNLAEIGTPENPATLSTTIACGTIFGDIYGGSNKADIYGNVTLTVNGGSIVNVYGGSKGTADHAADIHGNTVLNLYGGSIVNAFGGNNVNGNISGTITVTVDDNGSCGPLKIDNVYGAGNQASYTPTSAAANTPMVNVVNGTVDEAVFGGGLGTTADVVANPQVTIGGTGVKQAVVGGTLINSISGRTDGLGNVFGGGSQADVIKDGSGNGGNTHVILTGNADVKGNVYGGGNQADVRGNTKVELR